jgi:hypothetical protein
MSKAEFVRSLQFESKALSPFDISQRLRQTHSCVSIYQGDADLKVSEYRGYMVRYREKRDRTPENPELYVCVISLKQSKPWQDLVWVKEILHILDKKEHFTSSQDALGHMLDSRRVLTRGGDATPLNVGADKNGFTLALGAKVPMVYRNSLRNTKVRPSLDSLEAALLVPKEFIDWLLADEFEQIFETALAECDLLE